MVRKIICGVVFGIAFSGIGQQYTNVAQVMNVPLTEQTLKLITPSANSTPDGLFLAFMKACAQGHLQNFLSLFTDEYIASEFGIQNRNSFSIEDSFDFQRFFNDDSVTNRMIVSYSCVISGNVAKISARVNVYTKHRVIADDVEMGFIKASDIWKINQWGETE